MLGRDLGFLDLARWADVMWGYGYESKNIQIMVCYTSK
jgi:hypothetical protein